MKTRSAIFGFIIMVLWLSTLVLLVQREAGNELPALSGQEGTLFAGVKPAAKWQDIEEWMLIVRQDPETGDSVPIGAAHTTVKQLDHLTSGAAYRAEFSMQGKVSPLLPKVLLQGTAVLDKDANLAGFYGVANGVGLSLSALGEMHDDVLYIKTTKPNASSYSRRRIAEPLSLSEVLRPTLSRQMEIKPGAKMSSPVINPLNGEIRGQLHVRIEKAETITLDGKPVKAFQVKTSVGDIETLMWVDAQGRTLRRNLMGGIRMDKTTRERALEIAPALDQSVRVPELDLEEFRGMPISGVGTAENTDADGVFGSGLLGAIWG